MDRRNFLRYSAGGLAALALGSKVPALMALGCAPTKATPKTEVPAGYGSLRMVGGSLGSSSSTAVVAFSVLFNKYYPEIEWSSSSGASITNAIYVTKGTLKLGTVLPSSYVDAYGFDKIPESRLRSIIHPSALLHYVFHIPEDKPWKDITEVPKGSNLCPGPPGTGAPIACEAWLKAAGLGKKDFNWLPLTAAEQADAWRAGKVDLIFTTASGISPSLRDMNSSPRKVKAMGLSPEQVARAKAELIFERLGFGTPTMSSLTKIAGEVFKYDVVCPQVPLFLSCRDDFPEEIAYKMARITDERHAELVQIYPALRFGSTPQHHIQWAGPPLDIHPGVAKYYKEKGYLK